MSSYSYPPLEPPVPPASAHAPQASTAWGPFTAGELVRRTFSLYREHAPFVIGLATLNAGILIASQLPILAVNLLVAGNGHDPARALRALPVFVGIVVVTFFLTTAVYAIAGGSFFVAVLRWREGLPTTISEIVPAAGQRFGAAYGALLLVYLRLLGWYFLSAVPLVILFVIFGVAAGAGHTTGNTASIVAMFLVGLLAFFFMLAFIVWQLMRYSMTVGVIYAENTGALDGIRRSIQLTRHNKGRIGALMLLLFVISFAFMVCFFLLVLGPLFLHGMHGHAFNPQMLAAHPSIWISILQLLLSLAFTALVVFPLGGIGLSLCYLDLRARAGAQPLAAPPLGFAPVPPPLAVDDSPAPAFRVFNDYPARTPYVDQPRSFRSDPGRTVVAPEPTPEEQGAAAPEDEKDRAPSPGTHGNAAGGANEIDSTRSDPQSS